MKTILSVIIYSRDGSPSVKEIPGEGNILNDFQKTYTICE